MSTLLKILVEIQSKLERITLLNQELINSVCIDVRLLKKKMAEEQQEQDLDKYIQLLRKDGPE